VEAQQMAWINTFEHVAGQAPHRGIVSTINHSTLATPAFEPNLDREK
jgi:hypothetical protein